MIQYKLKPIAMKRYDLKCTPTITTGILEKQSQNFFVLEENE